MPQYITITFNSSRWRPRSHPCHPLATGATSRLENSFSHCGLSNSARDGGGGGDGGMGRTSDYKNERTNEICS